ncbi:hypothetical protein FRC11_001356, partial [Ceratobasidium sp. 423]
MSQPTPSEPSGPVSKRRQKRITDRRINKAAAEADGALRAHIETTSSELGVSATEIYQRFTLISPIGEQRSAMWWNGLVIEKSSKWKSEYSGPGREFLSWVTHRIREEGLAQNLTNEQKTRLVELATKTRAKNKDTKTTGLTRKQAVANAQEQIDDLHKQLETLYGKLGVEYMLVTTRGKLEDNMPPTYISSDKVDAFLQGHMNMPMRDLLTHLDFYVLGKEPAGAKKIKDKKQALRSAVRTRLKNSLSDTLKNMGVDPSTVRCVEYANYDKLVYSHRVVLVGYPVKANGRQMVRPSDFPGGIKGLMHADNQLSSGIWRFEELPETAYNEWKVVYEQAVANQTTPSTVPYIPVPGSEYEKGPVQEKAEDASG